MKQLMMVVVLAMLATSCGLFGGDETVTTAVDDFTPEPTTNVVEQAPAATPTPLPDAAQPAAAAADQPLPTALPLPVEPTPTPDRSQPTTYVVQSGDVLGLIAEQFDVDIAELRRVNGLSGNLIRVGQSLTIPALTPEGGTVLDGADGADDADSTESASGTDVVGSTTPPEPAPEPTPVSCGANAVGHCVQSGETLSGLASRYDTTADAFRAANPSITGDTIRIGDLLTIPGQTTAPSTDTGTDASTDGDTIVVQPTADAVAAPQSDADCAARNAEFPFFHAADGLCYANPIGDGDGADTGTAATGTSGNDIPEGAIFVQSTPPAGTTCPDNAPIYGLFELDGVAVSQGACFPALAAIPPTATVGPTPTSAPLLIDYGQPPCDEWEVVLENGNCWPTADATDEQVEEGRVKTGDS